MAPVSGTCVADISFADIDCFAVLYTYADVVAVAVAVTFTVIIFITVVIIVNIISILTSSWSVATFHEDNTQGISYFLKCKVLYISFADMETRVISIYCVVFPVVFSALLQILLWTYQKSLKKS